VVVHALTVAAQEDRPVEAFTDGQVDGACRPQCERDGDDLAGFTSHRPGAVAALETKVVDVRAEGFEDPQPGDRQQ
jgi:hypothetical protein